MENFRRSCLLIDPRTQRSVYPDGTTGFPLVPAVTLVQPVDPIGIVGRALRSSQTVKKPSIHDGPLSFPGEARQIWT